MKKRIFVLVLMCAFFTELIQAQDQAALDPTWEMGIAGPFTFTSNPYDARLLTGTLVLPGDSVLVYGGFSNFSGVGEIARLLPDGAHDPTFSCSINGVVMKLLRLEGGKLMAVGNFTASADGLDYQDIARLHPDGSIDTGFEPLTFTTDVPDLYYPAVMDVEIDATGNLLIAGNFTTVNGADRRMLVRLMPDGSLDNTFDTGTGPGSFSNGVTDVLILTDGRIIVSGYISEWNGVDVGRTLVLFPDGSLDDSFDVQYNTFPHKSLLQPDGKVIRIRQYSAGFIQRLNTDLSVDTTFSPPSLSGACHGLTLMPDGRILVVGPWTGDYHGMVMLETDGSIDPDFDVGEGFLGGFIYGASHASLQSDGKILVSNYADTYRGESISLTNGVSTWNQFVVRLVGYSETPVNSSNVRAPNEMLIWPNPAGDYFHISPGAMEGEEILIYDSQGRVKLQTYIRGESERINTSEWAPGIYVVSGKFGRGKVVVM